MLMWARERTFQKKYTNISVTKSVIEYTRAERVRKQYLCHFDLLFGKLNSYPSRSLYTQAETSHANFCYFPSCVRTVKCLTFTPTTVLAGFVTTNVSIDRLRKSQTYVLTCKKITECHRGPDTPAVKVNGVCEHHKGETFQSPGIKIKADISFRRSRASCSSAGGLLPEMLP